MRLPAVLLLVLIGCRTEPPQQPVPPRIVQLPSKTPIKPSTRQPPVEQDVEPAEAPGAPQPAPAQDTIDPPLRQMMTPAGVVVTPSDAGPDAIVNLPPVPDAQVPPLDAHPPVPE